MRLRMKIVAKYMKTKEAGQGHELPGVTLGWNRHSSSQDASGCPRRLAAEKYDCMLQVNRGRKESWCPSAKDLCAKTREGKMLTHENIYVKTVPS